MTILACVWGVAPGAGKSTLCSALSAALADAGLRMDHFREEEVLTRTEFASVAGEFRRTGAVELPTLLAASALFAAAIRASGADVVVADALAPFVPTLLALGHGDQAIAAFTAELAGILSEVSPILVYLDGSPGTALARAAEREGPQWLAGYVGKLARYEVRPRSATWHRPSGTSAASAPSRSRPRAGWAGPSSASKEPPNCPPARYWQFGADETSEFDDHVLAVFLTPDRIGVDGGKHAPMVPA